MRVDAKHVVVHTDFFFRVQYVHAETYLQLC